MNGRSLDRAAYQHWADELRVHGEGSVANVILDEAPQLAPSLGAIAQALDRMPVPADTTACEQLQRICRLSRAISTNQRKHSCSAMVREHFEYHDSIFQRLTGNSLADLFQPFTPRETDAEIERILRVSIGEFILHLSAGFQEREMICQDDASPAARTLIVNGFYRSGSTKVFLAAHAVLRALGQPFTLRAPDLQKVDELLDQVEDGAYRGKWVLIKTHYWMPLKKRDNVLVFFTRRRLADVAASNFRRTKAYRERGPDGVTDQLAEKMSDGAISTMRIHQFINSYVLPRYDMAIIDYEDYDGRDRELLLYLANQMGLDLSETHLSEAAAFMSVLRVKQISDGLITGDLETFIQPHHISPTLGRPGGGLDELPPRIVSDLKQWGLWPDRANILPEQPEG